MSIPYFVYSSVTGTMLSLYNQRIHSTNQNRKKESDSNSGIIDSILNKWNPLEFFGVKVKSECQWHCFRQRGIHKTDSIICESGFPSLDFAFFLVGGMEHLNECKMYSRLSNYEKKAAYEKVCFRQVFW